MLGWKAWPGGAGGKGGRVKCARQRRKEGERKGGERKRKWEEKKKGKGEKEREREIRAEITASIAEPIRRVPRSPACADEATGKGVEMLEIERLEQGKIPGIRADFELNDGTLGFENNYRTI